MSISGGVLALRAHILSPRPGAGGASRDLRLIERVLRLAVSTDADGLEVALGEPSGDTPRSVEATLSGRTARLAVVRLGELQSALEIAGQAVRGVGLPLPERTESGLSAIERVQVRLRAHLAFAPAREERWLAHAMERTRQATTELLTEAGTARLSFTVGGWRRLAPA
ncbi:MAG: hypothetical protein QM635_02050 [Microbacteriaceae bacterium]